MSNPAPSLYENAADVEINDGNPIVFPAGISKGSIVSPSNPVQVPLHLWNDKGGGSAALMENVKLGVKDASGTSEGQFIDGTPLNGNQPFYEVRSYGAQGCVDDAQAGYQAVGGDTYRNIGNIPANARRNIWVRVNVPADADSGDGILDGLLVVDYTFTP
ncbi:MAG: hypothetical protein KIS92_22475 [Planctomycetota bacterium]|nr:hypothetical protein [Planctomycetota bacterium]